MTKRSKRNRQLLKDLIIENFALDSYKMYLGDDDKTEDYKIKLIMERFYGPNFVEHFELINFKDTGSVESNVSMYGLFKYIFDNINNQIVSQILKENVDPNYGAEYYINIRLHDYPLYLLMTEFIGITNFSPSLSRSRLEYKHWKEDEENLMDTDIYIKSSKVSIDLSNLSNDYRSCYILNLLQSIPLIKATEIPPVIYNLLYTMKYTEHIMSIQYEFKGDVRVYGKMVRMKTGDDYYYYLVFTPFTKCSIETLTNNKLSNFVDNTKNSYIYNYIVSLESSENFNPVNCLQHIGLLLEIFDDKFADSISDGFWHWFKVRLCTEINCNLILFDYTSPLELIQPDGKELEAYTNDFKSELQSIVEFGDITPQEINNYSDTIYNPVFINIVNTIMNTLPKEMRNENSSLYKLIFDVVYFYAESNTGNIINGVDLDITILIMNAINTFAQNTEDPTPMIRIGIKNKYLEQIQAKFESLKKQTSQ